MSTLARLSLRAGARMLEVRARVRLNVRHRAPAAQAGVFRRLLAGFSQSRFGQAHGIDPGMDYEEFRTEVPIRAYEDFTDYIDRMRAGEPDQLWPGRCRHFAVTSGTTAGPSKYIPVNEPMLQHFRKAGLESLLLYSARTRGTGIFQGRHLFLGGATRLERLTPESGPEVFAGDLSGITAVHMPRWADTLLYEPGREIALLEDWPTKIEAIADRTISRDIRLVAGIPSWLLILFERLQQRATERGIAWTGLRSIWPRFECLVHGGVPVDPYLERLRLFTGDTVKFHEVFPASEGFLAAQDTNADSGLRLLDNAGILFEFLPVESLDANGRSVADARAVSLSECDVNRDYALVLTTPAGLCRYLIGDVVRLISVDPPRMLYSGRTQLQLSAFGEHVIERELTESLSIATRNRGIEVAQFHVAPLFACPSENRDRGRHEWWIELRETISDLSGFAEQIDHELQRRNDDYAAKRRGNGMAAPEIRIVQPGTFETWLKAKGRWGGQNKVPRCRSDRIVAEELSITHAPECATR